MFYHSLFASKIRAGFLLASQFSNERKDLCEKIVDVCAIEPDIWNKHTKVGFFHRPFFGVIIKKY
jgi:hypothetical protein